MKDDQNKDRELLENLDRILSGQENEITEPVDDDTGSALEFARKMASLRETPSKEFSDELKTRLVHKLAEQERKDAGKGGLFSWELPHPSRWQGTLGAIILVIVILIILAVTILMNPTD